METATSTKKAIFTLDEERSFRVKISMGGTTNLPNTKPIARFVVAESSGKGIAVLLPTTPTNSGVQVTVPPMKNIFSEGVDYVGKLEIIFGNRYFTPMVLGMQFVNGVEISATPELEENDNGVKIDLEEDFSRGPSTSPSASAKTANEKNSEPDLSVSALRKLMDEKIDLPQPRIETQKPASEKRESENEMSFQEKKNLILSKIRK